MSPEQRATTGDIARLRREISTDREAMSRREDDLRKLVNNWSETATDRAKQAFVGVLLHAWYTGVEAICERVARQIDRNVPTGERWHQDLLSQALTEIPNVRPAVLSSAMEADLIALLAFRHFFRHAYGAELDVVRLKVEVERLARCASQVAADLDRFDEYLGQVIAATTS